MSDTPPRWLYDNKGVAHKWGDVQDRVKLTILNFSGGKQSSCLLWMILNGDLQPPEPFVVLNADPGMENPQTYEYVCKMFEKCRERGIRCETAEGPDLYQDLLNAKREGRTRVDLPAYWTKNRDGSQGRLLQRCTRYYKVAPMDKAVRRILRELYGIAENNARIGNMVVNKWIGFSLDEIHRIKPSQRVYQCFEYPLVDRKMARFDVLNYLVEHGHPVPPRSVCNACFSNGVSTLKMLHDLHPKAWEQAVAVDQAVRDSTHLGVEEECYVSKTMLPLTELEHLEFDLTGEVDDADEFSCDSGMCFI